MKKVFFTFALLFFALCGLSGCLFGNAEGYGFTGDGKPNGNASPSPGLSQVTGYYYWVDAEYTCEKDGVTLPSYRNAMYVSPSKAFLIGDLCKISVTEIPYNEVAVTHSGLYLTYKEGVYSWLSGVITETNIRTFPLVEELCFAKEFKEGSLYDLAIEKNASGKRTAQGYLSSAFSIPEITRTDLPGQHVYSQKDFQLTIETVGAQFIANGHIALELQESNLDQDLKCHSSPP